jgi:hypothetical protein
MPLSPSDKLGPTKSLRSLALAACQTRVGWSSALIEGPTLADQIAIGPLALDDALSISKQIIL